MLPFPSLADALQGLPGRLWPVLAAGILSVTAACAAGGAGSGSDGAPPLRGTTWVLVPAAGESIPRLPNLRLDPEQPRVSGHSGCNRLHSSFELDGQRLRFAGAATTKMACLDGEEVEQRFLQALAEVRGWRIAGGQLLLTGDDGATLLRLQPGAETKRR